MGRGSNCVRIHDCTFDLVAEKVGQCDYSRVWGVGPRRVIYKFVVRVVGL
jgi:hypothetical protein